MILIVYCCEFLRKITSVPVVDAATQTTKVDAVTQTSQSLLEVREIEALPALPRMLAIENPENFITRNSERWLNYLAHLEKLKTKVSSPEEIEIRRQILDLNKLRLVKILVNF